jgi:hypothetical protein
LSLFFDTDVLVYAFLGGEKRGRAVEVLAQGGVISAQALNEFTMSRTTSAGAPGGHRGRGFVSYLLLAYTQRMISSLGKIRPSGPSTLYISARWLK